MATLNDIVIPLRPTEERRPQVTSTPWSGGPYEGSAEADVAARTTQEVPEQVEERLSYADMVARMSPYKPRTAEEEARDRRKERRDKVFAAIGDGLSAFNVAYSNARGGVKPIATPGLSGRIRDRYERLKKEREANEQQYVSAYLRAMQGDDAIAQQKVSNMLAVRRQDRLDRETKIKEDKAAAYQQYQASVASKNEEQAAYWRAKWEALEAGKSTDEALKQARAAQSRAAARLADARANNLTGDTTTRVVVERDSRGRETGRTTTKTNNGSRSSASKFSIKKKTDAQTSAKGAFSIH